MPEAIKKVLAATDMSRPAFAALRRAALIARTHGAQLEIVHVVSETLRMVRWNELRAAFAHVEADFRSSVTESLDALVAQLAKESGIEAKAVVLDGKPFAEIAARSEAIGADVIVVGAHGENVATPLLGTTAHRVLRVARKPVLLVKRTPPLGDDVASAYRQIVVATDFSDDSLEAATSATRLFPQASVTLFHAYEAPFEGKLSGRVAAETLEQLRTRTMERAHADLDAFASAAALSHAARVARHGLPGVRIREFAADISADLIAIGSEEVSRMQTALLGSVSLDIVTAATCDVLLARTPVAN